MGYYYTPRVVGEKGCFSGNVGVVSGAELCGFGATLPGTSLGRSIGNSAYQRELSFWFLGLANLENAPPVVVSVYVSTTAMYSLLSVMETCGERF